MFWTLDFIINILTFHKFLKKVCKENYYFFGGKSHLSALSITPHHHFTQQANFYIDTFNLGHKLIPVHCFFNQVNTIKLLS